MTKLSGSDMVVALKGGGDGGIDTGGLDSSAVGYRTQFSWRIIFVRMLVVGANSVGNVRISPRRMSRRGI